MFEPPLVTKIAAVEAALRGVVGFDPDDVTASEAVGHQHQRVGTIRRWSRRRRPC